MVTTMVRALVTAEGFMSVSFASNHIPEASARTRSISPGPMARQALSLADLGTLHGKNGIQYLGLLRASLSSCTCLLGSLDIQT